jgi:hypothetical protein
MPKSLKHLSAFREGIQRARLIREDLKKTLTEYEPEKVRGLNKAYISTIKEAIRQGNLFVDKTNNFDLGLKVIVAIENFKAFLSALRISDKNN